MEAKLSSPSGSLYGNPPPASSLEGERQNLLGRLNVARGVAERSTDPDTARRWRRICDELLDHFTHLGERAETARIDRDSDPQAWAAMNGFDPNPNCGRCGTPVAVGYVMCSEECSRAHYGEEKWAAIKAAVERNRL